MKTANRATIWRHFLPPDFSTPIPLVQSTTPPPAPLSNSGRAKGPQVRGWSPQTAAPTCSRASPCRGTILQPISDAKCGTAGAWRGLSQGSTDLATLGIRFQVMLHPQKITNTWETLISLRPRWPERGRRGWTELEAVPPNTQAKACGTSVGRDAASDGSRKQNQTHAETSHRPPRKKHDFSNGAGVI